MKIIKRRIDIALLKDKRVLPEELMDQLEGCFTDLENSFEKKPSGIYPYCLIVLIEPGDDIVDLAPVLTGTPAKGLLDANFENVELLELGCGGFFHVSLVDDGRQTHIFFPSGVYGDYFEMSLKNQIRMK